MEHAEHDIRVPKGALLAAFGLVLFALAAATTSRVTGYGTAHMTLPAAVESRDLLFKDGEDGSVLVYDAADNQLLHKLAPGQSGFVRVVMRGMARERKIADIGPQPPFRITRYANGQLTLTDTANNRMIDLNAFGSSNLAAFAALITTDGSK